MTSYCDAIACLLACLQYGQYGQGAAYYGNGQGMAPGYWGYGAAQGYNMQPAGYGMQPYGMQQQYGGYQYPAAG